MTHKLLERQLRKLRDDNGALDQAALLRMVSQTYEDYDRTLDLQDAAARLMSDELNDLNASIRKERDDTVAETQKRFELAIEGTNDGLWDWNVKDDKLWFSPRVLTMLGLETARTADGGMGDWYALLIPDDRAAGERFIGSCVAGETPPSTTLRFKHKTGGERHIMCRVTAVRDPEGRVARVVGVHTDITALVFMNKELKRAKALAEAASAAKSDFLANMSHELRTPLNSILGMTRLLSESGLRKDQEELAGIVHRSSLNLLDIVNDILDLSKIEAGEVTLESVGFDIVSVCDGVLNALDHLAMEKRLPLKSEIDRSAFPYVLGDPLRVTRILMNLISNAIKYTDSGHILLRASCKREGNGEAVVTCEVEDTGIGIPKDKIQKVFEKFAQADNSTTRRFGGTGLGLAITRELVEMMGGKIGVRSDEGKGSTFWVTIPFPVTSELSSLRDADKGALKRKGEIPAAAARILIAEDHPLNQVLISKLVEKFGVGYYEIVNNGREALEKLPPGPWHLILMDCQMPELSGYDTTKHIRLLEKDTGGHVPIVAMTANAMVGEKEKCLRCGMDDYISKPLNTDDLKLILGQWIDFDRAPAAPAPAPAPAPVGEGGIVDPQALNNFSGGDREMEKDLVGLYIEQTDKNMAILQESLVSGDGKMWREAAHMMKGGSAGIGAGRLSALCERAQHSDGPAGERGGLFKQIETEYAAVKKYFRDAGLF